MVLEKRYSQSHLKTDLKHGVKGGSVSELKLFDKIDSFGKNKPSEWSDKRPKRKTDDVVSNNTYKKHKYDNDTASLLCGEDDDFDWTSYLKEKNSVPVPRSIFKHVIPECLCGFESGMKLEVPNFDYKETYWLASIIVKSSPLILVRYEGYTDSSNDFWLNTLSSDIHPVGWCARNKHALKPPKSIQYKEKNWYTYLIKSLTGAKKASENLFQKKSHPAHYLRAGHYIEVLDTYNPTCYWLARVSETYSGRLNMQFEGIEGKDCDMWCFYLNCNLRPVGYGLLHGLTLMPPKGVEIPSSSTFNRVTSKVIALSKKNNITVFKSLFTGLRDAQPHNLTPGMKLEAVHPQHSTCVCPATVSCVFDPYFFKVQIDNLIACMDEYKDSFVAHRHSSVIFPVGFCQKNNIPLKPPGGYNGKFIWESYLKYTKCIAAPQSLFHERPLFHDAVEPGMKLEAVDKENPTNICVSTVRRCVDKLLWLSIDGDSREEQIYSLNGHDIFPVGWCEKTGHELQWPRPNTLEQKNRISSLRQTAMRQTRLEVLRKGRTVHGRESKKEKDVKRKTYLKGRRGFSRDRVNYDSEGKNEIVDTSVAIVCINQLAEEYNSEASIKEHFNLDAQGRLPTPVVTIEDDDDTLCEKESKYTDDQLDYLSFVGIKPNDLNNTEEKYFYKKINSAIESSKMSSLERCSLDNGVALLRYNRKRMLQPHNHKKTDNETSQKREKVSPKSDGFVTSPSAAASSVLGSVTIPGKGRYEVVEQVVTRQDNKFVLRLSKKQTGEESTPLEDMDALSNMARTHQGLDEIFRARCNTVLSMSLNLPKNPLQWTESDVYEFVQNATQDKHGHLFYKQEIDGHAFLLLTVHEIHNILGVRLGAAVKLHDFIFTLQQLSNASFDNHKKSKS